MSPLRVREMVNSLSQVLMKTVQRNFGGRPDEELEAPFGFLEGSFFKV